MMESINFKSINQNQLNNVLTKQTKLADVQTEEQEIKDAEMASKTPMEMLGRSQVNFKQKLKQFSVKDLNYIGEQIARCKFNNEELSTYKAALLETMNELKLKDIKQLREYALENLDNTYNLMYVFLEHARKINPEVDAEKIHNGVLLLY